MCLKGRVHGYGGLFEKGREKVKGEENGKQKADVSFFGPYSLAAIAGKLSLF